MQHFVLPLTLLAIGIIFVLSAYAAWLLFKLCKQNKQQKNQINEAITKRNTTIIESVDIIALAALQKQCDLSEAAIRLYMIMEGLQGKMSLDFSARFPALFELYQIVKDMPRGDDRKTVAKKERMRLDFVRIESEARLEPKILTELEGILIFTGAKEASSGIERK